MTISPLSKKLLIKPGHRVLLLNTPEDYAARLQPLPEKASLQTRPAVGFDAVHLFVQNSKELERLASSAIKALKIDGSLWIAYPKKTSGLTTDLTRDSGWGT